MLVASDAYKGSLTSREVIQAVKEASERIGQVEVIGLPIADGGEGTLDSILEFLHGKRIPCEVTDPLGRKISTYFGLVKNDIAIVEMAASSWGLRYYLRMNEIRFILLHMVWEK